MRIVSLGFAVALLPLGLAAQATATNSQPLDTESDGVSLTGENAAIDAMNQSYLMVWRTLMVPKNVADAFGKRIAQRYIALQVTIANRHPEYQWLVQDVSVDLLPLLDHLEGNPASCPENLSLLLSRLDRPQGGVHGDNTLVSSADLTVLRGVSEKGEAYDPRSLWLRVFTGAGAVASGLMSVTTFGPSFAPGVAAFNGTFLTAYQNTFPDFTSRQLNRLNDSAFAANTVIGKQQAKVIVIFLPMEYLLTKKQAKQFWKDPESVFACADVRLLEVNVDGNFVTAVQPVPAISAITLNNGEAANFAKDNFQVHGVITGRFLKGAAVELVNAPSGVTIAADGEATEERYPFVLSGTKPLMPGLALQFQATLEGAEPVRYPFEVLYSPALPVLAAGALSPATIAPGSSATVTITGTNFLPEGNQILVAPADGITIGNITYQSNTAIAVEITVAPMAATGQRQLRLSTKGGTTNPGSTLTIQ